MANLDHPNIVRLYGETLSLSFPPHPHCLPYPPPSHLPTFPLCSGICVANPIRLVMELASLGPLNKFLRRHP